MTSKGDSRCDGNDNSVSDPHEDAYQARRDTVTLRDLFDQRWQDHETKHTVEDQSRREAGALLNIRLEGMNEFRRQIDALTAQLLRKDDYENRHQALSEKVDGVEDRLTIRLSKLDTDLAGVTTGRIATIEAQLSGMAGRFLGSAAVLGVAMTVVGWVLGHLSK